MNEKLAAVVLLAAETGPLEEVLEASKAPNLGGSADAGDRFKGWGGNEDWKSRDRPGAWRAMAELYPKTCASRETSQRITVTSCIRHMHTLWWRLIEVSWTDLKQTLTLVLRFSSFFTFRTDVALFGAGFHPITRWNSTLLLCFRSLKADISTHASFSELFQASWSVRSNSHTDFVRLPHHNRTFSELGWESSWTEVIPVQWIYSFKKKKSAMKIHQT